MQLKANMRQYGVIVLGHGINGRGLAEEAKRVGWVPVYKQGRIELWRVPRKGEFWA